MIQNSKSKAKIIYNLVFYLSIEGHDRKLTAKLFDKIDVFHFCIDPMLYLDSNIPYNISHALVGSDILRTIRTAKAFINMVTLFNLLLI